MRQISSLFSIPDGVRSVVQASGRPIILGYPIFFNL